MERMATDLCVIGAGAGGLSVAAGAVQMGARVVLIEAGQMGGDCLNHGCVPSKALLAAARAAQAAQGAPALGVTGTAAVDYAAAQDHVARTIAAIAPHDSQERFEALGCRVIRARARFTGRQTVEAGGVQVTARRVVIATGSRPLVPPVPGLGDVPFLTNETIFALRQAPAHLLVLGGGPVGMEMAQAHRRLGCAVTVVEGARALGREDPDLAAVVLDRLRTEGVTIREGVPVARVAGGDGVTLHLADGSTVAGSHLLVAAGRVPALDDLGLEAAGVARDARGIRVDARLRSVTNRRVFAVGDAAGQGQFTHLASYHAGLVIRQALFGLPARARTDHIPRATYTDPELAQVGPTAAEARAAGLDVQVLSWPLAQNDRALAEGRPEGLVKVLVHRGRVIGAGIAGAGAGEQIAFWSLAVAQRLRISAVAGVVLPYPTRSEAGKRAAGACYTARLFDNPGLRRLVRLMQRLLP